MNELQLLRTAGPQPTPLAPATLHAARAALLAEIAAAPSPADQREPASVVAARQLVQDARSRRRGAPARRRPRRVVALWVGVAVLTAAAVLTGALIVGGPDAEAPPPGVPRDGVELVDFSLPAFPLTLTTLPPGAGEPVLGVSGGGGGASIGYTGAEDPLDLLSLSVSAEPAPADGPVSFPGSVPEDVVIDGAPGVLVGPTEEDAIAGLSWQRSPGQWVVVQAQGRYADRDLLLAVAAGLVDQPQGVPVQLHLAPAGYRLDFTKDDGRVVRLADDTDPYRGMTVRLLSADGVPVPEGTEATDVTVQGQPARLLRTDAGDGGPQGWVLQALLPDGTAFVVEAPGDLTEAQVVEIADQVSSTP